ncbi:MAG: hypothetical protein WAQ25_00255 [Candidatus Saccharimonas sp.]
MIYRNKEGYTIGHFPPSFDELHEVLNDAPWRTRRFGKQVLTAIETPYSRFRENVIGLSGDGVLGVVERINGLFPLEFMVNKYPDSRRVMPAVGIVDQTGDFYEARMRAAIGWGYDDTLTDFTTTDGGTEIEVGDTASPAQGLLPGRFADGRVQLPGATEVIPIWRLPFEQNQDPATVKAFYESALRYNEATRPTYEAFNRAYDLKNLLLPDDDPRKKAWLESLTSLE